MPHPYKSQLLLNLAQFYDAPAWRSLTWFDKGRDEILFILPFDSDVQKVYQDLLITLNLLPDILHSAERCVISFCHPDGSAYCSRLINPVAQDQINLALIGYTPGRTITLKDLLIEAETENPALVFSKIDLETDLKDLQNVQLKAF